MNRIIEQELFKMDNSIKKTYTTIQTVISHSWLEINSKGFGLVYLMALDDKGCLKNKYVFPIEQYNPLEDNFKQGLYKLTYCEEDIQDGFPIPLVSVTYIRP